MTFRVAQMVVELKRETKKKKKRRDRKKFAHERGAGRDTIADDISEKLPLFKKIHTRPRIVSVSLCSHGHISSFE